MFRFMLRRWKWLVAALMVATIAGWSFVLVKLLAPVGYIDTADLERLTWNMTKADVLNTLGQPEHYDDWSGSGQSQYSGMFSYKGILKEDDKRRCRENSGREPDRAYFQVSIYLNREGKVCQKGWGGIGWEPTAVEKIQAWLREHMELVSR
jgi:hypothetical protein